MRDTGRDTWACRLVGGSQGPHKAHYSETGAGCQCASPGFAAHITVGSDMHSLAAAGAAFLLAVLWFDLMFDVQTRKCPGDLLPPEVLASISALLPPRHDRSLPDESLVALVMVLTLAAICTGIVQGVDPRWIGWMSIALAGSGFVLTITRTAPNAVRLGSARDTAEQQSTLARAIYRDHPSSFARMIVVLGLQLTAR